MAVVLVIGASRGIGLELVRQYAAAGWRVHATTRTPAAPGALGDIAGDVSLHALEVVDAAQRASLAAALASEAIDVLIHNAGVHEAGRRREDVMRINAEAPLAVAAALLPALERGSGRKLVLMSSQMGARRGRDTSLGVYGDSKAALNDGFRAAAPAWADRGITAVVMHPGWVRTAMGGRSAPLSVADSARGIRRTIDTLEPARHGHFLTWEGREHPW